jgi:hypothetical protein
LSRPRRAPWYAYGPGARPAPVFWILAPSPGERAKPGPGPHISLQAPTRSTVDAFFETALRVGGCDAGGPGSRPQSTSPFYGAFVVDPDGFKIEAVCRMET